MYISRFINSRPLHHLLFWGGFITVFTLFLSSTEAEFTLARSLEIMLLVSAGYCLPVYINILYLIPHYLLKERSYLKYFFLLFTTLLLSTPIVAAISWINFSWNEAFISNFSLPKLFLTSFVNTAFMVFVTTGLKLAKDWFNQLQRTNELEQQKLQSELKYLKAQVNPHFLFNTLNNLYALSLTKDDRAPETVLKLSELLRYTLYECNEREVLLSKEAAFIQNYLDLETIRLGKGASIEFELEGELTGKRIAPLLLVPFIENCFKHGVNNRIVDTPVDIRLSVNGPDLYFFVKNEKAKKNTEASSKGGIGLKNVQRRLNLLYHGKHQLEIVDKEEEFIVKLELKLD